MKTIEVEPIEIPHFKLMHIARSDMQRDQIKYRKLESGEYEIFCPSCLTKEKISFKELKRIRTCGICPHCFTEKKTSRKETDKTLLSFIDETDAVWMRYTWNFDEGMKIVDSYHCLHILPNGRSWAIRSLHAFMYNVSAHPDERNEPWKVSKAQSYTWNIRNYWEFGRTKPIPKKQYYSNALDGLRQIVKPNQVKLMKDNLYNAYQVRNMVIFNLDYDEDIIRHKYRIRKEDMLCWMLSYARTTKLNKYYLTYLEDNRIDFYVWLDHLRILEKLNMKLEKPKKFQARHHELAGILAEREKEENALRIIQRFPVISQKEAVCEGFVIHAFKSADEITNCGNTLKNCIGSYIKPYANGSTDLFYMTDNEGKMIGAIEVKDKKVKQAYGICNKELPAAMHKKINEWAKANY